MSDVDFTCPNIDFTCQNTDLMTCQTVKILTKGRYKFKMSTFSSLFKKIISSNYGKVFNVASGKSAKLNCLVSRRMKQNLTLNKTHTLICEC